MKNRDDARNYRLAYALGAAALVALTCTALVSARSFDLNDAIAVAVLGILAALATNLDVDVESKIGLSGNAMFLIAALVVFREDRQFLGVALVAILGSIDHLQVRNREHHKILINAGTDSLALLAGAAVFWAIAPGVNPSQLLLLAGVAVGAGVYYSLQSVLLGIPVSIARDKPYRPTIAELLRVNFRAYPFAVLGLGLGWVYLELGAAVVPLLVVPILIARRTFASYLELRAAQEQTIETLILALEAKDPYTAGHAQRVADFCEYVGAELGFGPSRLERLRYAALMHDIGKLVVPNQLLNKPGRLTEAEFERVRRHEGVSVELLRRIDFLAPVAGDTTTEAATAAVGGAGLIEPAIIHVADAFDAMTSTRSYRRALSQETAFGELRDGAGTQFNAECVDALIASIERRGEHFGAGFEVEVHDWETAPPEAGTGSAGLGDLLPENRTPSEHGADDAATQSDEARGARTRAAQQ
jgi:hypothetical protein